MKSSETILGGGKGIFLPFVIQFSLRFHTEWRVTMREYNSAFFREFSPVKGAILSGIARICFQSIRKLVSTERERERERRQNKRCCARLGASLWWKKRICSICSAQKDPRGGESAVEEGREEGRKGLLENRRRQREGGWWFGGCHHRFSMLDAPCLLAIVKG